MHLFRRLACEARPHSAQPPGHDPQAGRRNKYVQPCVVLCEKKGAQPRHAFVLRSRFETTVDGNLLDRVITIGRMDDNLLHALFASDLAQDVRAEFNARCNEGCNVADATSSVIDAFNHLLARPEEGPVVIIAIAALQLRDRALHPTFRDAAIDLLDEGHGFDHRPGEMMSARGEREQFRRQLVAALTEASVVE